MSDLKFLREPTVYPFARTGSRDRYFIARDIYLADGGFQTQALAVSGEWVDRPQGFTPDAEVTFYGRKVDHYDRIMAVFPPKTIRGHLQAAYVLLLQRLIGKGA